jgi:hypothetical protein
MVILRATSILGGQKEDKWMMCSITLKINMVVSLFKDKFGFEVSKRRVMLRIIPLSSFYPPKFDVALKITIKFMIDHY